MLPITAARIPAEIVAGSTLAAVAVPEVMGYTRIAGMLGLNAGGHGTLGKLWIDLGQLGQVNRYTLTIALTVLAVIVGLGKLSKKIPGALIAAIGALVASWAFGLDKQVHVVGACRVVCHTWVCPRSTGAGPSFRH